VHLDHFIQTKERSTFTYCKPLIIEAGKTPRELNRLDQKNWTPTPQVVVEQLRAAVLALALEVDAFAILTQVDQPETGVVTLGLLDVIGRVAKEQPEKVIVADSRHGLRDFPPVIFKMNRNELANLTQTSITADLETISASLRILAQHNRRSVFVTLAERGIIGVAPSGEVQHVPALPVRDEIDIVGAGDAVMANLTAALAAGANVREAIELANAAASIVIHQLGTTGAAWISQIKKLVCD
jgi:bifunctional ADP-heptose synthase (sugar kinase/adenylyltransferase)